jgi:hypothetical protein
MEICVQPKITCSNLMAHQGIVLVRSGVELCRDKPQSGDDVLAGVCVPDGDGPKLPRLATIEYHHGRKCWHIKVEHSRQQRNEFLPGNLPDLVRKFEEMFNVTLPAIQVRHLGVGIYPAHSDKVEENPWAFVDGQFYRVRDKARGERTFVADVRDGRTLISFFRDGEVWEPYDPRHVLSADDWRTLTPLAN